MTRQALQEMGTLAVLLRMREQLDTAIELVNTDRLVRMNLKPEQREGYLGPMVEFGDFKVYPRFEDVK